MLHMDNIVLTSIIAAGSACLGALIPSLFSLLGKKQEYTIARLAKIDDVRREEFAIYLDSLQRMVNEGNRDNFLKLQASTNRVVLYSGPELSNLVIDYFNTLVDRTNSGHPLLHDEQEEFLTEIVNAMRAELGITKIKLKRVRMVRA